jgi:hypothetical protein
MKTSKLSKKSGAVHSRPKSGSYTLEKNNGDFHILQVRFEGRLSC